MLALALLVLAFPANVPAKAAVEPETVKVKIEASEMDRRLLLQKLNEHGAEHGMKFVLDEKEFNYRIEFATEQGHAWNAGAGSGGSYNTSEAKATVYDEKDGELFHFSRAQRRTDTGATNAVAKEIIKRMLKLKETPKT
ncbi:MAG TPA: hypothetical protein VKT53_01180 [Candidatus Acidoferrum sp.]|nr:hypothetical protein [Candidatus Acidoferrum sp.]